MAEPSKKRQERLRLDADVVMGIYQHACKRWGKDAVDADLTRIWDMRCILGMQRAVPFGSIASQSLGDVLWVAENVCGLRRRT